MWTKISLIDPLTAEYGVTLGSTTVIFPPPARSLSAVSRIEIESATLSRQDAQSMSLLILDNYKCNPVVIIKIIIMIIIMIIIFFLVDSAVVSIAMNNMQNFLPQLIENNV